MNNWDKVEKTRRVATEQDIFFRKPKNCLFYSRWFSIFILSIYT